MKRLLLLVLGIAISASVFLVACGGGDDGGSGGGGGGASGSTVSMTIANFAYSPATLTARAGQAVSVSLSNNDSAPHSFTIDGVVDSGVIAANAKGSANFTPSQTGTLTWFCTVHGRAAMSGTITVSAGASSEPADATDLGATVEGRGSAGSDS
jgi:plastocyanin